jgi:phage tail tube protein FII
MVFVTRKAEGQLNRDDAMECLERHMIGDYGELDDVDWKANDAAWEFGFPVVSSYFDRKKNRFLIVTESDRSATTILLPDEY